MICCEPFIQPFNEAITTLNYTPILAAIYGSKPNVQVYYREDENFVLSNDMSEVRFDGTDIVVDHGGVQVGFIKVF